MIVFGKERDYIIHDDEKICGFFGDYRFLSNYEWCTIQYEGLTYSQTESAYQAMKSLDMETRVEYTRMGPSEAKKISYKLPVREDWKDVRVQIMYDLVKYKFEHNEELKKKLLDTGNKYLEETNHWKDIFWGVCNGIGENNLGKILMQVRKELYEN